MKEEYTINTEKRNVIVQLSDKSDRRIVGEILNKFNTAIHADINHLNNSVDLVVIDTDLFNKNTDQLVKLKKESSARLTSFFGWSVKKEKIAVLKSFQAIADDVVIKPLQREILSLQIKLLMQKVNLSKQILEKKQEVIDKTASEWKNMVEQSPDVVQISIDGKIEYINPAGARIYGAQSCKDLIGQFVRHPQDDMTMDELNTYRNRSKRKSYCSTSFGNYDSNR